VKASHDFGVERVATITLKSIVPSKTLDPHEVVTFQIETSVGREDVTFSLNDQGSPAQNAFAGSMSFCVKPSTHWNRWVQLSHRPLILCSGKTENPVPEGWQRSLNQS
jgi:hypothetical protein